jgi:hypothetical protein
VPEVLLAGAEVVLADVAASVVAVASVAAAPELVPVEVEVPLLLDCPAWLNAENKSCKKVFRSCGRELELPVPPVEPLAEVAVEAAAELVLLVVPVVAAVVAAVAAPLEVLDELAGLSLTNWVRADSNALNSLPPSCVEAVPLVLLLLESEPSSLCRCPPARCVPSSEERLNVEALVLVLTALVDIMHSL